MASDVVPRKPPRRVRGTEMQNQSDRRMKYKEIGMAPVLLLPHRTKFRAVRITKTIPGKKHAVDQATDL